MYLFKNNTVVPTKLKDIEFTGNLPDERIAKIEAVVAFAYHVKVTDLDVFYKDTDAKFMCCFLVHDLLHYTVKSIAVKYGVNTWFLHVKIQEHYQRCLQDIAFMDHVSSLRDGSGLKELIN